MDSKSWLCYRSACIFLVLRLKLNFSPDDVTVAKYLPDWCQVDTPLCCPRDFKPVF